MKAINKFVISNNDLFTFFTFFLIWLLINGILILMIPGDSIRYRDMKDLNRIMWGFIVVLTGIIICACIMFYGAYLRCGVI